MNWDVGLWEDSCEDSEFPGGLWHLYRVVICSGEICDYLAIDKSSFAAVMVAIPLERGASGRKKAWFQVESTILM